MNIQIQKKKIGLENEHTYAEEAPVRKMGPYLPRRLDGLPRGELQWIEGTHDEGIITLLLWMKMENVVDILN